MKIYYSYSKKIVSCNLNDSKSSSLEHFKAKLKEYKQEWDKQPYKTTAAILIQSDVSNLRQKKVGNEQVIRIIDELKDLYSQEEMYDRDYYSFAKIVFLMSCKPERKLLVENCDEVIKFILKLHRKQNHENDHYLDWFLNQLIGASIADEKLDLKNSTNLYISLLGLVDLNLTQKVIIMELG